MLEGRGGIVIVLKGGMTAAMLGGTGEKRENKSVRQNDVANV